MDRTPYKTNMKIIRAYDESGHFRSVYDVPLDLPSDAVGITVTYDGFGNFTVAWLEPIQ